jgi:hypothetical protein
MSSVVKKGHISLSLRASSSIPKIFFLRICNDGALLIKNINATYSAMQVERFSGAMWCITMVKQGSRLKVTDNK